MTKIYKNEVWGQGIWGGYSRRMVKVELSVEVTFTLKSQWEERASHVEMRSKEFTEKEQ